VAGRLRRLDQLLLARGLAPEPEAARRLIVGGEVLFNGRPLLNPAAQVAASGDIRLLPRRRYVSRAGEKLAAGLTAFGLHPHGWTCLDVGASTGGFTDCLLQAGAARVYSVDVGHGLLDWGLRQDARVTVLERTNAKQLTRDLIALPLDLAVIDASFIGLAAVLAPLPPLFSGPVRIIALVKPQFELPRELVPTGGVVRDPALRQQAVDHAVSAAARLGLCADGTLDSPVAGAKGNREILLYLVRDEDAAPASSD